MTNSEQQRIFFLSSGAFIDVRLADGISLETFINALLEGVDQRFLRELSKNQTELVSELGGDRQKIRFWLPTER